MTQKWRISINRDLCFFTVSFAMPATVLLSQWIGVFGCIWPTSSNINQMIFVSLPFMNNTPNSASAAEVTTNFNMLHTMKMLLNTQYLGRIYPGDLEAKSGQKQLPRLRESQSQTYCRQQSTNLLPTYLQVSVCSLISRVLDSSNY